MNKELHSFASGSFLITKMLEGTPFAGTGTKQELVELEKNLRQLLQLRMYPYSYIEKYLVSQGYRDSDIRNIFQEITGLKASDIAAENQQLMTVPGMIPQENLGWGEAKGNEYEFLFVMPWLVGYAVFGQKCECEREEVQRFDILEDAREYVKKHVKEYKQFDQVIDVKLNKPKADWFSSFTEPKFSSLSEQGIAVLDFVRYVGGGVPTKKNAQYIKDAYFNGLLSKDDFTILASKFITAEAEDEAAESGKEEKLEKELSDLEKSEAMSPIDDEIKEDSPNAFFDNQSKADGIASLSPMTAGVEQFLISKSKELSPDFSMAMRSFKFISMSKIPDLDKNVTTSTSRPDEMLQNTGVTAVILNIQNNKLQGSDGTKPAMMVFSLRNGKLHTNGVFKGVGGGVYAMTKEGMHKYFADMGLSENEAEAPMKLF